MYIFFPVFHLLKGKPYELKQMRNIMKNIFVD